METGSTAYDRTISVTPTYGVVIPAYNAGRTLAEAIESVLAQTIAPTTIVVVDDGSADTTASITRAFGSRVHLLSQDNRGPASATDLGWAALDTDFIAGLDADDLWRRDKAERQLEALNENLAVDAVFCRAGVFMHGKEPRSSTKTQDLWGRSTIMMRREAMTRVGPVHSEARPADVGEMIRWIDRARRSGLLFTMMPDILADRRIITGSLSYGRTASALLSVVKDRLRNRLGDS